MVGQILEQPLNDGCWLLADPSWAMTDWPLVTRTRRKRRVERLWYGAEAMRRLMKTEDFAAGPRAFIEKQPPAWKAR